MTTDILLDCSTEENEEEKQEEDEAVEVEVFKRLLAAIPERERKTNSGKRMMQEMIRIYEKGRAEMRKRTEKDDQQKMLKNKEKIRE